MWKGTMTTAATAITAVAVTALSSSAIGAAAPSSDIPDLSAGGDAWLNEHNDFILPASGPGPVTWDPAHPFYGNGDTHPPTNRVADLTNPILLPWVREHLKKFNEIALQGKPQYTPIARCWPAGVPGTMLLRTNPMFIAQTPREVTFLYQSDHQVRHIYMNVPHSANIRPSWYGESVGHYEGDTLVVDTVGITPKAVIDYYTTPHTEQLHVVERYHRIDGGKTLEVTSVVEDPGAFTMPWTAMQRYERRPHRQMEEYVCAEGEAHAPSQDPLQDQIPIPKAAKLDF